MAARITISAEVQAEADRRRAERTAKRRARLWRHAQFPLALLAVGTLAGLVIAFLLHAMGALE